MLYPENSNSFAARQPRTWGFWQTAFFSGIAYGIFGLVGSAALWVVLSFLEGARTLSSAQQEALVMQGHWQGVASIAGSLSAIAVLWIAIREARRDFAEYLALNWPSRDELVVALTITVALWVAEAMFMPGSGAEGTVSNPYLSVGGPAVCSSC